MSEDGAPAGPDINSIHMQNQAMQAGQAGGGNGPVPGMFSKFLGINLDSAEGDLFNVSKAASQLGLQAASFLNSISTQGNSLIAKLIEILSGGGGTSIHGGSTSVDTNSGISASDGGGSPFEVGSASFSMGDSAGGVGAADSGSSSGGGGDSPSYTVEMANLNLSGGNISAAAPVEVAAPPPRREGGGGGFGLGA
jgi:hypothetical protein